MSIVWGKMSVISNLLVFIYLLVSVVMKMKNLVLLQRSLSVLTKKHYDKKYTQVD